MGAAIRQLKLKKFNAGIPVRYHDYEKLTQSIDHDFIEFHMSEIDLKLDQGDFISEKSSNQHLYVHCIEQYNEASFLILHLEMELLWESFKRAQVLFDTSLS